VTKDLAELKNVGPTIKKRSHEIGIYTRADLERIGPVSAYRRICQNYPNQTIPVCYYLYSLQGALMGVHWDHVPEDVKAELFLRAKGKKKSKGGKRAAR
jgi:DNA transformation protein and related proteins